MNELILLFLEKVCEAIYFSLFLLYGKNIKEKRILFTLVMIFEYLMLTSIMEFNVWIQIIYTFMSFINLKVFYKEKAQITDLFLFMIASIVLIIISFICGMFQMIFGINHYILLVINRIIIFAFIILIKDEINNLYKKYYKLWNRNNNKTKIRSLTLRNISIVIFNFMFYIINIGMIYRMLIVK